MDQGSPSRAAADHARTIRAAALVAVVAVHSLVLMILSSRRSHSTHSGLSRFLRFGLSAVYLPLMSYVLSYLTTNLWSMCYWDQTWLLMSVVLIQFIKAKADMAALAIAAAASPAARDDDINSLKVRPSTESLIYSFWVAGLVIYNTVDKNEKANEALILIMSPLWILGACRMVLRYVAFQRATVSWALGRNVQLIDGYIAQLQLQLQEEHLLLPASSSVPRLIVTGESDRDVEETPLGYRVKRSILDDPHPRSSMLITLDRVWSESDDPLLGQQRFRDLCLSFALFKCLRRRFAGCQPSEAGSSWAFRFVRDGLLGPEDDHERIFRVIAVELAFARDFYYSHLPVASLGTMPAALHFLLSVLIFVNLCILLLLTPVVILVIDVAFQEEDCTDAPIVQVLAIVLAVVTACIEISEMVASVRSSWTKMSIVGHYIRCHNRCARGIFSCLLRRYRPQVHWKDEIGQIDLLLVKQSMTVAKVAPEAKASVLRAFRSSSGQLMTGTTAVQRRCEAFQQDITWACLGGELTTTTDTILVWCIATSLFKIRCSSVSPSSSSSEWTTNMVVAGSLSRYCTHLVVEAPDLLPDNAAWTKRRYKEVMEKIDAALLPRRSSGGDNEGGIYHHLIGCFGNESSHEVLRKGSRLGKQLVEEAGTGGSGEEEAGAGARDGAEAEAAVWELLAEFWSEMLLYLAPSDNVKAHIEVLQRGGELITLLWALLLHAGISSRPVGHVPDV